MKIRTLAFPILTASLILASTLLASSCANGEGDDMPTPDGGASTSSSSGGPITCDDAQKRCAHIFSYASAGTEKSVEVRGDFAAGAWDTGVPMSKMGNEFVATVQIPYNQKVSYKFVIDGSTWIADPKNSNQEPDGFGGFNSVLSPQACEDYSCVGGQPGDFQWSDGVLYFVFVDRFLNGNPSNDGSATPGVEAPADYHGGDYAGVLSKINEGYFNDLGVNILWLTVPANNTEQPGKGVGTDSHLYSAYHGYWPKDMDQVEEHFGSMEDLKALVDAAHAKNIRVILDYAMNHLHNSSAIYAAHPDWFWPNDNGSGGNCICGDGCPWDGPTGLKCWFTGYLPDFNFTNAAARQYSVDNALWWINQTGIDGFRLDAIKHVEMQWLLDLRSRVSAEVESKTGQHFYMVGETYTGDIGLIKQFVDPKTKLDGQFDFPLRMQLANKVLLGQGTMQEFEGFLKSNDTAYPQGSVMSTFIGNHDIPRPIHLAEDKPLWTNEWTDGKDRAWSMQPSLPSGMSAFERLALSFAVLFTLKGMPLIYYGDEVAMPGAGDPDNRRDMQWSGYSPGQTFVKDYVSKLTKIRSEHKALRTGSFQSLSSGTDTLAYKRSDGSDTVYIAINRGDSAADVNGLPSGALSDLLSGSSVSGPSINIPPRSAMILVP